MEPELKQMLDAIQANMVTKQDLEAVRTDMVTKQDLEALRTAIRSDMNDIREGLRHLEKFAGMRTAP